MTLQNGNRRAFKVVLPPLADRPPDTIASLDCWNMVLPGDHAFWDRYSITACSLADFPGVQPAKKQFPEATHEILVFAIDPKCPQDVFERGENWILTPQNHHVQCVATDESCNKAIEELARLFVDGNLWVEPQGVWGARDQFKMTVYELVGDNVRMAHHKELMEANVEEFRNPRSNT